MTNRLILIICILWAIYYRAAEAQMEPTLSADAIAPNASSPSDASCPPPTWPSTEVCSGHGTCISGRCVCDAEWSDRHDLLSTIGQDCVTPITARLVLNIIAFVSGCLCIMACCYALLKHRMLVLCYSRLRQRASVRTIIQQYQIILSLVVACSCCASLIRLNLDKTTQQNQKVVLRRMNRFFFVLWILGAICLTIAVIGGHFAGSRQLTEALGRMYAGVFGFALFLCSLLVLKFSIDILGAISASIERFRSPILMGARQKLRLTVARLFPALLLIGLVNISAAIFPVVLSVYLPFNGAIGCLNSLLRIKRELLPNSEGLGDQSSDANSDSTAVRTDTLGSRSISVDVASQNSV